MRRKKEKDLFSDRGEERETKTTTKGDSRRADQPEETSIKVIFWKNGFSVDDGGIRSYTDPANQEFLRSIQAGFDSPSFPFSLSVFLDPDRLFCLFQRGAPGTQKQAQKGRDQRQSD